MSPLVREALCALLAESGLELSQAPKRLRASLSDQCPQCRREIAAIVAGAECGIPKSIIAASTAIPWEVTAGRLAKRMADETAISEDACRWVVDSWGTALGRVTNEVRVDASPSMRAVDKTEVAGAGTTRRRGSQDSQPTTVPPRWVYSVFGLYVFTLVLVASLPIFAYAVSSSADGYGPTIAALIVVAVFFALGASLLIIPVGQHWNRARAKRSIVIPCIGSATCAALLCLGGLGALHELAFGSEKTDASFAAAVLVLTAGVGVWIVWCVIFAMMARSIDRLTLSDRMYQRLLAGSALELFVALPMHLVVRRRTYCCAGSMTALGIGLGITVTLIALGPAVFFLVFRRYRQAYADRSA